MPISQGCSPGRLQCETSAVKSRQEIYDIVRNTLVELFELEEPSVVPEARFNDDLEIDSIDAVDLIDHLARIFERRVSPRDFRAVRTVQDLIDTIDRLQTR
jgi:acyl carrier protein